MKQYDTLRIDIRFIPTNDICTSSPISETGIDFSDLIEQGEQNKDFGS